MPMRRKRRGGAEETKQERSLLGKLNDLAKETKIISRGLNQFGITPWLANSADTLGYGRRRKPGPKPKPKVGGKAPRKKRMGRGLLSLLTGGLF